MAAVQMHGCISSVYISFKWYSLLHFAVCQLLCWAFLFLKVTISWRRPVEFVTYAVYQLCHACTECVQTGPTCNLPARGDDLWARKKNQPVSSTLLSTGYTPAMFHGISHSSARHYPPPPLRVDQTRKHPVIRCCRQIVYWQSATRRSSSKSSATPTGSTRARRYTRVLAAGTARRARAAGTVKATQPTRLVL